MGIGSGELGMGNGNGEWEEGTTDAGVFNFDMEADREERLTVFPQHSKYTN